MDMDETSLDSLARQLGERAQAVGMFIAVAESCTGGWLAKVITDIPGSSGWFDRGFVTYSNAAKQDMLDVRAATLEAHGAVSEETAAEMARGALAHSRAGLAVAITGIAGPGGAVPGKPVGTVCFGFVEADGAPETETRHFPGDRRAVRMQSVRHALEGLLARLAR